MKFDDFENIYKKENKKLKLLMTGIILGLVAVIVLQLSDKKYFVLKNSKLINDRPLLTWVCNEAFGSITKGKPEKDLIMDSVLLELKKSEFKVVSDEVLSTLEIKKDLCRIIVKGNTNGSVKIRSFLVSFKTSNGFPFYYKLFEITESEINLDEIAKTSEVK